MGLQIALLLGLLGAFLMFLGDMALYYDKNDCDHADRVNSILRIMKSISRNRLYIGGLLGPASAFLYCMGYYHILLFTQIGYFWLGFACFLLCCIGIIFGGAYHSHYVYLGLISRHEHKESLDEVFRFLNIQKMFVFGFLTLGNIFLAVLIALGWTILPRWMALFTPAVLMLLSPAIKKLPKGLHIILWGGWTNIVSIIYYAAALITLSLS